jgi:hypothetical protein
MEVNHLADCALFRLLTPIERSETLKTVDAVQPRFAQGWASKKLAATPVRAYILEAAPFLLCISPDHQVLSCNHEWVEVLQIWEILYRRSTRWRLARATNCPT